MQIDDDLWPAVRGHAWKWQGGRVEVAGIIWHATRSGIAGRTAAQEYGSALNWFRSPNNVVRDTAGDPWYGAMAHYVIGGGRVCRALPEELVPRFSAGVHDFRAISVEVGQATRDTAFDPRDIALCRELAAELSA
ncbi:MAG: peptidoglycan recognition protein family protein, partial [Tepidiformaceae bacterium]